ncbi:unnamed protein product [Ilex paraguariensis]|uniref:AAA+ ATPase domain-containing protein n=2 Tax=Ilex paraguariensis TaxID=185542 RepID=A0ABC8RCM6_9AQUA
MEKMVSNMFSDLNMPSAKTLVSTVASVAASAIVVRSIVRDLVPYELQQYVFSSFRNIFKTFSSEIVVIIEKYDGLVHNQIYRAAGIYLGTKISPSTQMFKVSMPKKETKIKTSMASNQEIIDNFNGVQFKWRKITRQVESSTSQPSSSQTEIRFFRLSFRKKHKAMVFDSYFPFILKESKKLKQERKTLKIRTLNGDSMRSYSRGGSLWKSITFDHPANFDTLAMDTEMKRMIMDDLERFVRRKELYRKVGKAWKRGYLLYGPPGTGKSSLIAAMANYLNFDIYDLELTAIHSNSDLRKLLIGSPNQSILVVEDIDCSLEFEDRKAKEPALKSIQSSQESQAQTVNIVPQQKLSQVTLSGLFNFIDGLWSSCGDQRIIIFTTNHKDRIDPTLLRPGRMDLHIHMSYCTPCAFKTLAMNYLGITEHSFFPEINDLLEKTMVSPAEIGEQLLKNEEPEAALQGLIEFLQRKKRESEEMEARKLEGERDMGKSEV